MVQEILKCLAQAAVGLHPSLVQLALQPALELCPDRATVSWMVSQPLGRPQPRLAGGRARSANTVSRSSITRGHSAGKTSSIAVNFRRPCARQGLRRIAASSSSVLTESASDITIGGPRWGFRRAKILSRFSPAWARPAKYRQIVRAPVLATKPVVYIPVRGVA